MHYNRFFAVIKGLRAGDQWKGKEASTVMAQDSAKR